MFICLQKIVNLEIANGEKINSEAFEFTFRFYLTFDGVVNNLWFFQNLFGIEPSKGAIAS